jgi:hypothetical protein
MRPLCYTLLWPVTTAPVLPALDDVLGLQRPLQNHQNFGKSPEINTHFPKSAPVITQVFLSGCGLHRPQKGRKITSSDPKRSSGSEIFADRMAFILAGSRMSGLFHTLMDGAIPIEVSVLCVLRREKNSPYRLLVVV